MRKSEHLFEGDDGVLTPVSLYFDVIASIATVLFDSLMQTLCCNRVSLVRENALSECEEFLVWDVWHLLLLNVRDCCVGGAKDL